jgi:hypothetical protein
MNYSYVNNIIVDIQAQQCIKRACPQHQGPTLDRQRIISNGDLFVTDHKMASFRISFLL